MLKLGSTNLTINIIKHLSGDPEIGGIYYLSFGYNVF
jgi:hypothetical protein